MANALLELMKREQVKMARNVFELAGYYTPMGKLPDMIDYVMMQKRIELLASGQNTVKGLWPQASDAFAEKLKTRIDYTLEQQATINELAKTCKGQQGLSVEEQFDAGLRNSRLFQVQAGDTGRKESPSVA